MRDLVYKEFELVEGTAGYDQIWHDLDMLFRVWFFDVSNPDAVMDGALPELIERGPYVYDMKVEKDVIKIDEEADEMDFYTIRTYYFNKKLSFGSEDDEITIINSAYMGTIGTIVAAFPSFLKKLGNNIQKLYPGMYDIFARGKVSDVLFGGLPMECDPNKYKELKLICSFLTGKKPAVITDTEVPGVYKWSFFRRLNGTRQGPLTVNRGVKNKTRLGDTTAYKGKRVQSIWKSEECNAVLGTDSVTWPPMEKTLDYVHVFEPQICRWIKTDYKEEVTIHNLMGDRYELNEKPWSPEESLCYCPVVKKQPVCPPSGLVDLTPCLEAPIFYSEPHFMHGDPALLEYAKGLRPDPSLHATFVTIEPLSGIPLSGSKKSQLNVKVIQSPVVEILSNVTEGYFPILWVEEGKNATLASLGERLQIERIIKLLAYMVHVPLVIGIFVILKAFYLQSYAGGSKPKFEPVENLDSVLVRQNPRLDKPRVSVSQRIRTRVNRF
ncbi:sensory neuron membrane protein 2-like isoform X2 [Venturia canescens]|nr:sensory neuron membrane protein 2-like isoform X2 [Venturia canescens]